MQGRRARKENFSDTTPAAPEGYVNGKWQSDRLGNRSVYVPESAGADVVSDAAYSSSWNGVTDVAPSKNAVYDKIESLGSGGGNGNPYNICTFPDISNFTWTNQGDASGGNTANGYLYIAGGANSQVRLLRQTTAGAAHDVIGAFTHGQVVVGSISTSHGLWLHETSGGGLIFFGLYFASGGGTPGYRLVIQYFTNTSTYSSEPANWVIYPMVFPLLWLRITDDGSSLRRYYVSYEGEYWIQVRSEGRTSHITSPNHAGPGIWRWTGTEPSYMFCAHYASS